MNSSNSSVEEGNTKTSSTPKKQDTPKIAYCLTLNNWTEEEYSSIVLYFQQKGKTWIIGKEIGDEGTPHLQMYIRFKTKTRFSAIKKVIERAHIEVSKGNEQENLMYCSKESNFKVEPKWTRPREVKKVTYDMLREDQKKVADYFNDYEDELFGE